MKIEFLGGHDKITGTKILLEHAGKRILIDCGLEQDGSLAERIRNNGRPPVGNLKLDLVILTHAHIDHSGLIPSLVSHGYAGNFMMTAGTKELIRPLLSDCLHIMKKEAMAYDRKHGGITKLPYCEKDIETVIARTIPHTYGKWQYPFSGLELRFCNAGHIHGSSYLEIIYTENRKKKRLIFSGDLGRKDSVLHERPNSVSLIEFESLPTTLITEATYGSRIHEPMAKVSERLVQEVIKGLDGGKVLIPVFAMDRLQSVIGILGKAIEDGRISKSVPIYIDTPLGLELTRIYAFDKNRFKKMRMDTLNTLLKISASREDSEKISKWNGGAGIVLAASGMGDHGRAVWHLEQDLGKKDRTVIFVGHCVDGSLGHKVISGRKSVKINGNEISVSAKIAFVPLSAHADSNDLMAFADACGNLKEVIITHGPKAGKEGLLEKMKSKFPKADVRLAEQI